jgi:dihydroceramide fatty acyl 2-hydroxylase
MSAPSPPVDYDRPLLAQVAALGDRYDAWVHRSIKPGRSLRIFQSDLLEAMTHVPWWLVLVVWVPVVVALEVVPVLAARVPAGAALLWALLGAFLWTLLEYLLHRFVFHWKPRSAFGRQVHFLAHGIHHLDPWDGTRLVFPPVAGALVASAIFLALWAALPLGPAMATMGGLLVGYLAYDMTHYYTHHAKPRGRWGRFVKRYHLAHHHKHWERMFGVSQPLWDLVFRTGEPRAQKPGLDARPGRSGL